MTLATLILWAVAAYLLLAVVLGAAVRAVFG